MSIRAIVFDVGGVLKYTPRLGIHEKWEQKLGLNTGELSKRLSEMWESGNIGKISIEDIHHLIGEKTGLSAAEVNAFMDDIWTEYIGTVNQELVDYFKSLRPQYKTGILSNSFVGAREREQKAYCLSEMTETIIYSHEVGMAKPDQRIYELTCQRLGVQPTEMIFLDDVVRNIEAARVLGIHGILFKDNAQAIAEIQTLLTV